VDQSARTAWITGTTAVRTGRTPSIPSALSVRMLNTLSLAITRTASRSHSITQSGTITLSSGVVARIMDRTITTISNVTVTVAKLGQSIVVIWFGVAP